jgi:predicted cupin superfamily sugar epimerase
MWFYHQGAPINIHCIVDGALQTIRLGLDISNGEVLQTVIPAYTWFAAQTVGQDNFALLSCVVAPGFDFKDFELAMREPLIKEYPSLSQIITEFTKA